MELNIRHEIDAPIEFVFDQVSDFTAFERQAMRRGAEVTRTGGAEAEAAWQVGFPFRGSERRMQLRVIRFATPEAIDLSAESDGVTGLIKVGLVPLSPQRTALAVGLTLAGSSIGSKLVVQSLKLARGTLETRFSNRVEGYAYEVLARWQRQG